MIGFLYRSLAKAQFLLETPSRSIPHKIAVNEVGSLSNPTAGDSSGIRGALPIILIGTFLGTLLGIFPIIFGAPLQGMLGPKPS